MPTELIAGDASNESQLVGGNDGTLVVRTGLAGSKVTAMSVGTDGKPSFPQSATFQTAPTVTTAQSMVRLNTANGYGSTNNKIRRFTNVVTNQGADITYADSATLGASFTINTAGVYAISYSDNFNAGDVIGVTNNVTSGATGIRTTPASEVYTNSSTAGLNYEAVAAVTAYIPAGTVLVPRTGFGSATGTSAAAQFTIVKVA